MLNTISTPSLHDKFLAAWPLPNPARFEVGDEIEFEAADGWRWIITILGRAEDGEFECMTYDGNPHFLTADEETLAALRITQRGRMDEGTIAMYRDLLLMD